MAIINYVITSGTTPFNVELSPSTIPDNNHGSTGNYSFTDVPDGNYTITVTDGNNCIISFGVNVECDLVTTTSEPTEAEQLQACLVDNKIFEETLNFTPATVWWSGVHSFGSSIVEDANYIYLVLNDSFEQQYKHHQVLRYTKSNGTIVNKRITTVNGYYGDYHKLPGILISSTGALLVSIETLPSNNTHNSSVEVFRWADPSDLDTYTSTVMGPNQLGYNFLFEADGKIIMEARKFPSYRVYYSSNNDGVTFGEANQYINYGDLDYWMYSTQVRNNTKGDVILAMTPQNDNSNANCYQYVTYLKTDFSGNFYNLGGSNLGTVLNGATLESNLSWGNAPKNTNFYYTNTSKVFGDHIYALGYIGTRTSTTLEVNNWQVFKVNINTGVTTTGSLLTPGFEITYVSTNGFGIGSFFNICDKMYIKMSYGGDIYYYSVAEDLNSLTLIHTEGTTYHQGMCTDMHSELTADYNPNTNTIRVYRMSNPDVVFNMTTGVPTTQGPTTTDLVTTTETPTTTEASSSLKTSLVSVWEFDETSGTNAVDAHGSNSGTITGVAIDSVGIINRAYSFNGASSNKVTVTHHNSIDFDVLTEDCTINIWFKSSDPCHTNINCRLYEKREVSYEYALYCQVAHADNTLGIYTNAGVLSGITIPSSSGIWDNNWHMLTTSIENKLITVYLDGVFYNSTSISGSTDTYNVGDLCFGANGLGNGGYYTGMLDQPAIWGRALTSGEVSDLYNLGNGLAYANW